MGTLDLMITFKDFSMTHIVAIRIAQSLNSNVVNALQNHFNYSVTFFQVHLIQGEYYDKV